MMVGSCDIELTKDTLLRILHFEELCYIRLVLSCQGVAYHHLGF